MANERPPSKVSPAELELDPELQPEILQYKLNAETGLIAWSELARYFAAGKLILVANGLDLVEVAYQFTVDNSAQTAQWLETGAVSPVKDEQAVEFHSNESEFWAIVARPWVLIQLYKP